MTQAERRREGLIEAPDAGDSAEGVEGTSAVASMGPATQGSRSLLLPRRLPLLSGVGVGGRSRSPRASRGGAGLSIYLASLLVRVTLALRIALRARRNGSSR